MTASEIISIWLFIFVILGKGIALWIKNILRNNNYPVKNFSGYLKDIKNILNLAKKTTELKLKRKYFVLAYSDVVIAPIVISLFVFLCISYPSLNDSACDAFKIFKAQKFNAIVINKYIDKEQHSCPTLILKINGKTEKYADLVFDRTNFFEFVKNGDTLNKNNNDSLLHIRNLNLDTAFALNFGCNEQ
jgi:hypothetical protein